MGWGGQVFNLSLSPYKGQVETYPRCRCRARIKRETPMTTTRLQAVALAALLVAGADTSPAQEKVRLLKAPSGIRYGILGDKGARPAPTLFVFATALEESLTQAAFNKAGHLLARQGVLCVA